MKNIIIPKEIEYLLTLEKRKDAKNRILKIYEALLYKKGKKRGYFDCPSSYLKKISGQYNIVINKLIEYGVIEYYSKNKEEIWDDIFSVKERRKKYYNTENGHSIKYKFLIDISKGKEYNISIDSSSLYDGEKWYWKTRYSLLQLGFTPDDLHIKRDNFSRRLHTNITGSIPGSKSYKNLMSGGDYYVIDSKTSQPRLLWLKLKEIGLQDEKLNFIFDNDLDFYDYILQRMPSLLNDRVEAKELFASWVNGTGYLEEDKVSIRNIFPVVNTFIKNFKTSSYKDICRYLQYTEATIFIDDLLENIPLDFVLTVHDSILVRKEDAEMALQWCQMRRPELRFELEKL
jgi:hypothetical protein